MRKTSAQAPPTSLTSATSNPVEATRQAKQRQHQENYYYYYYYCSGRGKLVNNVSPIDRPAILAIH